MAEELDIEIEEPQQEPALPKGVVETKKSSDKEPPLPKGVLEVKKKEPSSSSGGESQSKTSKEVSDLYAFADKLKAQKQTPLTKVENKPFNPQTDEFAPMNVAVTTPTNLPASDNREYQTKVKTKEAINNALTSRYAKAGKKFDPNSIQGKKDIQELQDLEKNKDVAVVTGKDGKSYLTRGEGFGESALSTLKNSFLAPVKAYDINKISDPKQLADALDQEILDEPNVPESKPTGLGGSLGEMAGGLPKPLALLSINSAVPGLGTTAMVGEAYYTGLANQKKALYQRGLQEGLSREQAAQKAMEASTLAAVPDAISALALSGSVPGLTGAKSVFNKAADDSFRKSFVNATKSIGKMSALGAATEGARSGIEAAQGYDVKLGEGIEKAWEGATEMAKMDLAFKVAGGIMRAPKYLKAAALEKIATAPKELVEPAIEQMGEAGDKLKQDLTSYQEARGKVEGLVPEEHMSTFAGLTQKRDALEKSKEGKSKALTAPIDEEIKAIDEHLSAMQKNGKVREVDDLTGEPTEPVKTHDQLSKKEREGIIVPKEYGETEIIEVGEGENKKYKAKATYKKGDGRIMTSHDIPIEENSFSDKDKAQAAADEALGKHYYENGMSETDKPISSEKYNIVKNDKKEIKFKTGKGNSITIDEKYDDAHPDNENFIPIKIVSPEGEELGGFQLNDTKEGYQIDIAGVNADRHRQGIGKDAYISLIENLDKPLISGKANTEHGMTEGAKALWESLKRDGYATFNEKEGRYYSNKKSEIQNESKTTQVPNPTEGKISVITPEENKPLEVTTIAPKEHIPETKESGVTVILPKHETKTEVQQPTEIESNPTTETDKIEQPAEEKTIGVTKAETKQQREDRGLPDMEVQDTRGLKEMFASGKGMVEDGHIDPRHLAETVASKPRNLHSDEINALLYDRMRIINEHRGVMNQILNAIDNGDLIKEKELRGRAEKLEQARVNNEKAVKGGARENALALSTMQNMIKEDYSLASQKAKAIIANNGGNLSKETVAKLEKYDKDLQDALKKVEEHEQKISQLSIENEILKAKKDVAEEAKRNKSIKKDDIKAERKEIVDKLRAIAKAQRGKLSANPIPVEMIPFLGKLIRNLVREGIVELEDIVRHIHTELKDFVDGVTERDVRDAISGYGKVSQLSKDQVEKQVREIKSQGRLVSAIEDAESKKPPLKSGLVKSEPSSKVRELRKKLSDEMKKNGISTVDARKQLKTKLDSVKTRLKNSISDLTKAIEANEKMPKREHGIEYDTEAKELVKQRDEIRAKYDEIFGTSKEWTTEERQEATVKRLQEQLDDLLAKNVKEQKDAVEDTPEIKELRDQVAEAKNKLGLDKSKMLLPEEELNKKVEAALKLYDGVIKKYEERLRKNDTKPGAKRTPLESEELTAKRKVLDNLKEQYKEMYEASEDFEKNKLDDYKKRLQEQLESYQKRLTEGDFSPKEKSIPIQLDKKGLELKAQVEEIKAKFDSERKRIERENRPKLEKRLNLLTGWRRMVLLSNIPTLGKLVSAAGYRQATNFMEEIVGTALRQTPLIKDIAAKAEREGSPINFKRELRSLGEWKSKETFRDMKRSVTQGHTSLDYLYGGKHLDEPAGWIDFFGRVHMALKTPAKRAEFLRAYEIRAKKASEAGLDMTDPQAQFEVGVQAYEDANRAIFMQENIVTKGYNTAIRFLEGSGDKGKGAAAMMKIIFPIIKVPTNYVAETSSYAIGAAKAAVAIRKGISNLTSEQADYVMRALKKQGIGAAVLALGYFNPQALGGYYTGKRKEDDLKAGDMVLFGMHVPHWMSHAPLIEMLHIGATMRRVRDEGGSLGEATYQAGKGVATQVPFLDQPAKMAKDLGNAESASGYAGGLFRDMTLPPDVQRIARSNDVDENGEKIKRKPIGFIENYEMGIPKLRQKIRTDEQQKRIKQIESQLKGKEFDGIREEMINDVLSEN